LNPGQTDSADPVVDASVDWSYSVQQRPDDVRVALTVGGETVASETLRTDREELSNTTDLAGRVADSTAWAQSDFAPASGESVSHDVTVGVEFAVRVNETAIAEASDETTATVTVRNPEDSEVQVGGSATIIDGSE